MKSQVYYILLAIIIASGGCKKNEVTTSAHEEDILSAKSYFQRNYSEVEPDIVSNQSLLNRSKLPDWGEATVQPGTYGPVIIVPVKNKIPFLISTGLRQNQFYNSETVSKLYIFKNSQGEYEASVAYYLPDSTSDNTGFSGLLVTAAWNGTQKQTYYLNRNGQYRKYNVYDNNATHNSSPLRAQTICIYAEGWNYSAADPDGYHWTTLIGCYEVGTGNTPQPYVSEKVPDLGGALGGGGVPGSGAPAPIPTEVDITVESGNNPINNPKEYLKCFSTSDGNNNFAVRVCVSQPVPGKRNTWSVSDPISAVVTKSPLEVGHAFLFLTQSGSTNVMRNVGFFPSGLVSPGNPNSAGMLNNDERRDYDISITVGLSGQQFSLLLAYIEQAAGKPYNLDIYNCTNFVLDGMKAAGINFPYTLGTWPGGGGLNPGDLGEDLRSMPLQNNMFRNTSSTPHSNQGVCR